MNPPKKILFVCTGNICRSAMAEHLLRHWSAQRGLGLEVRSCGTAAESWFKVPEAVRLLLAREGVPEFEHRPKLLSREHLRWADLVLVMTQDHHDHVLGLYPEFTRKTRLLRAAAGLDGGDIEDPMNRPLEVFERSLDAIRESLEALARKGFPVLP